MNQDLNLIKAAGNPLKLYLNIVQFSCKLSFPKIRKLLKFSVILNGTSPPLLRHVCKLKSTFLPARDGHSSIMSCNVLPFLAIFKNLPLAKTVKGSSWTIVKVDRCRRAARAKCSLDSKGRCTTTRCKCLYSTSIFWHAPFPASMQDAWSIKKKNYGNVSRKESNEYVFFYKRATQRKIILNWTQLFFKALWFTPKRDLCLSGNFVNIIFHCGNRSINFFLSKFYGILLRNCIWNFTSKSTLYILANKIISQRKKDFIEKWINRITRKLDYKIYFKNHYEILKKKKIYFHNFMIYKFYLQYYFCRIKLLQMRFYFEIRTGNISLLRLIELNWLYYYYNIIKIIYFLLL